MLRQQLGPMVNQVALYDIMHAFLWNYYSAKFSDNQLIISINSEPRAVIERDEFRSTGSVGYPQISISKEDNDIRVKLSNFMIGNVSGEYIFNMATNDITVVKEYEEIPPTLPRLTRTSRMRPSPEHDMLYETAAKKYGSGTKYIISENLIFFVTDGNLTRIDLQGNENTIMPAEKVFYVSNKLVGIVTQEGQMVIDSTNMRVFPISGTFFRAEGKAVVSKEQESYYYYSGDVAVRFNYPPKLFNEKFYCYEHEGQNYLMFIPEMETVVIPANRFGYITTFTCGRLKLVKFNGMVYIYNGVDLIDSFEGDAVLDE